MNMQVCVSCSVLDTLQGCQTSLYFLYKLIFFSLLQNLGNQCFLKEFIKKVSPNLKRGTHDESKLSRIEQTGF